MIAMKTYRGLNKAIDSAHAANQKISVNRDAILKDIRKRKKRRIVLTVFVLFWLAALGVCMALAATGVLPDLGTGMSPYVDALEIAFLGATWSLCWVGFPVGWNMCATERLEAKSQAMITYRIDEHGYVDKKVDTVSPKIGAAILSFLTGCIMLAFSYIVAIVQIFTTKGDIGYIEMVLKKADE